MKCPNCGAENPEELKFCGQCGGRIHSTGVGIRCSTCGFINHPSTKFCGECGKTLTRHMTEVSPTAASSSPSLQSPRIRKGYVIGGGLTAAIFSGLFYWATTYTWTEQVWHPVPFIGGYWETVTRTVDPAIQALLLVVAIIGLIAMIFGLASRK